MSTFKYFLIGAGVLFGVVGYLGYAKKAPKEEVETTAAAREIPLPVVEAAPPPKKTPPTAPVVATPPPPAAAPDALSNVDRVKQLFVLDSSKLPFVETISYTSRVPWLKGRPAWISDYASHYETSRHFIARSLNKKADYFSQKVGPGDKFNVFRKDKNIKFHLLIDLGKSKMRFYAIDADANERYLLKTYQVGVGRIDPQRQSGYLTPIGKYEIGDKIAIYKPGTMGFFQDQKTEMIRIYGTRWIPFEKEVENCSEPAKGYGLHGAPWKEDPLTGALIEDKSTIGKNVSDGCVRLAQEDIEELFAIVITKPTTVELVRDFNDASLPGVEK